MVIALNPDTTLLDRKGCISLLVNEELTRVCRYFSVALPKRHHFVRPNLILDRPTMAQSDVQKSHIIRYAELYRIVLLCEFF